MKNLNQNQRKKERYPGKLIILVLMGIILNIVIEYLGKMLSLEVPVDHVGTILSGILGGPFIGGLTGGLSVLLSALFGGYGFAIVDIGNAANGLILGLIVGLFANYGWFKKFRNTIISGVVITIVYTVILILTVTLCDFQSAANASGYPAPVLKNFISTTLFVLLDKMSSIILVWIFLKVIGTMLLENIALKKKNLTSPINTQKLGTKLAEIPVMGPVWKKLVRLITIFYLDYILPLQKSASQSPSTSENKTLREGQYMFNQYRGYSFRLPENIAEWSKVKVQLLIGTIQFAGANPDLINRETIAEDLNLDVEDVKQKVQRMYDDHLLLLPTDAALQTVGFGLFYMLVKLKNNTSPDKKREISDMIRDNDYMCTSFETEGDYDFFLGAHITTIDNLYDKVMKHLYARPELERLTLLPIQRMLRQERINHWDMKNEFWRETAIIDGEFEKLGQIQDVLDETDLRIIRSMMTKRDITEYLNVGFLSKKKETGETLLKVLDEKRLFVCPVFLNWMKLNYQPYFFVVKFSDKIDSDRKIIIADDLVENNPDFNIALQISDSPYDLFLGTYKGLSDVKKVKEMLQSFDEIVEINEMVSTKQHRMWTIKLEEKNWGECVMMWE